MAEASQGTSAGGISGQRNRLRDLRRDSEHRPMSRVLVRGTIVA